MLSIACNGSHVAAGSELLNSQASVTVWYIMSLLIRLCFPLSWTRDLRQPLTPMLQYIESHNDDITAVSRLFRGHACSTFLLDSSTLLSHI